MYNVKGISNGGILTIFLSGHIDSANAEDAERQITSLREKYPTDKLAIDADKLTYISSAGLRILLRLRKAYSDLSIVNVSDSVYEILDMTGFTEMIDVEKAYRRISVDGCEVIGQGANGKVYRLDGDTIVKVYLNPDSLPDIKRETALSRMAFVLGLPTAIPFDVVRVGDGYGSVFEMLDAQSFAKLLLDNPEKIDYYVGLYVKLLKLIHGTEIKSGDIPDMKQVALGWAEFLKDYLPEKEAVKLVALISAVPERRTLIHGDYHIKNIMMQKDEVLLIDMDTLSVGHPVFELASMFLAHEGFGLCKSPDSTGILGVPYSLTVPFLNKSLKLYIGKDDETVAAIKEKAMTVGYARLLRRTIRRNGDPELIAECKKRLIDLIDRVDSLDF